MKFAIFGALLLSTFANAIFIPQRDLAKIDVDRVHTVDEEIAKTARIVLKRMRLPQPAREYPKWKSLIQQEENEKLLASDRSSLATTIKQCAENEGYFKVEVLEYEPSPIKLRSSLTINLVGVLTKQVGRGSSAKIIVKVGGFPLFQQESDLCDMLDDANIDYKCPLEAKQYKIQQTVDLPDQLPPGTFNVRVEIKDENEESVVCLDDKFKLVL